MTEQQSTTITFEDRRFLYSLESFLKSQRESLKEMLTLFSIACDTVEAEFDEKYDKAKVDKYEFILISAIKDCIERCCEETNRRIVQCSTDYQHSKYENKRQDIIESNKSLFVENMELLFSLVIRYQNEINNLNSTVGSEKSLELVNKYFDSFFENMPSFNRNDNILVSFLNRLLLNTELKLNNISQKDFDGLINKILNISTMPFNTNCYAKQFSPSSKKDMEKHIANIKKIMGDSLYNDLKSHPDQVHNSKIASIFNIFCYENIEKNNIFSDYLLAYRDKDTHEINILENVDMDGLDGLYGKYQFNPYSGYHFEGYKQLPKKDGNYGLYYEKPSSLYMFRFVINGYLHFRQMNLKKEEFFEPIRLLLKNNSEPHALDILNKNSPYHEEFIQAITIILSKAGPFLFYTKYLSWFIYLTQVSISDAIDKFLSVPKPSDMSDEQFVSSLRKSFNIRYSGVHHIFSLLTRWCDNYLYQDGYVEHDLGRYEINLAKEMIEQIYIINTSLGDNVEKYDCEFDENCKRKLYLNILRAHFHNNSFKKLIELDEFSKCRNRYNKFKLMFPEGY